VRYERRDLAESFGTDAEQYDRARPSYPAALFDYLGASSGVRVLDVGSGTGIVSRLLLARGCEVLGVEPDARMAEVARRHGLSVEVARFEEWDPDGRTFDLLAAGQAWHWVDPVKGAARAAGILRPGGRVGVFWNHGQPPAGLQAAFDDVYRRLIPERALDLEPSPPDAYARPDEECLAAEAAFTAHGGFSDVHIRAFAHVRHYSRPEWLDQMPTHSDHRALPPEQLAAVIQAIGAAIESFGGSFEMRYRTWLVSGRRREGGRLGC
jgi:SAM-dependent methyltransferase